IQIYIEDWAGHSLSQTINIYRGQGVELQIGSKTAYVNSVPVELDAAAMIKENRTFVPLRFVAEAFGATVTYNSQSKPPSVVIQRKQQIIELFVGATTAKVDGQVVQIAAAPFIINNRMMR
ncbi:MAG: copper amine oxidase N-terminal domain-containing protein, partial [Candidatus Cloacimonadaceae bacterium]|nr:copper amine oxidase N-terminal domain-containing protein [Candidatus Cloacimonadaceae bacterium]